MTMRLSASLILLNCETLNKPENKKGLPHNDDMLLTYFAAALNPPSTSEVVISDFRSVFFYKINKNTSFAKNVGRYPFAFILHPLPDTRYQRVPHLLGSYI